MSRQDMRHAVHAQPQIRDISNAECYLAMTARHSRQLTGICYQHSEAMQMKGLRSNADEGTYPNRASAQMSKCADESNIINKGRGLALTCSSVSASVRTRPSVASVTSVATIARV